MKNILILSKNFFSSYLKYLSFESGQEGTLKVFAKFDLPGDGGHSAAASEEVWTAGQHREGQDHPEDEGRGGEEEVEAEDDQDEVRKDGIQDGGNRAPYWTRSDSLNVLGEEERRGDSVEWWQVKDVR